MRAPTVMIGKTALIFDSIGTAGLLLWRLSDRMIP